MAARKHGGHLGELGGGKRHEMVSVVGRICVEGNHCTIGKARVPNKDVIGATSQLSPGQSVTIPKRLLRLPALHVLRT